MLPPRFALLISSPGRKRKRNILYDNIMFIFVNFDTYVSICNSTSGVCGGGGGGGGAGAENVIKGFFIEIFHL